MEFNLKRDIVFFDIESTGLNILRDRIVQIALIKHFADGRPPEELELLVNPGAVLISEEAYKVHGISAQDVANKPTFDKVAKQIHDFIGDADLSGYNAIRFDIPMLMEELYRSGIDFDIEHRKLIDVQRLFYKMEPRTLSAAYRFYCDKKIENAHDALADVKATIEVLKGQLKRYDGVDYIDGDGYTHPAPVINDMDAIHEFTNDLKVLDFTQRLKLDSIGDIVFNFGKYTGQSVVEVLAKDKQYYHWILNKEFSTQVKQIVKKLVKEHEQDK